MKSFISFKTIAILIEQTSLRVLDTNAEELLRGKKIADLEIPEEVKKKMEGHKELDGDLKDHIQNTPLITYKINATGITAELFNLLLDSELIALKDGKENIFSPSYEKPKQSSNRTMYASKEPVNEHETVLRAG